MNYPEHFAEHLRIAVLRVLDDAPGCRANSSILASAVHDLGLTTTRDLIKTQLTWLNEQGLVTTAVVGDMLVATLTDRGCDVAAGKAIVPGVRRPSPRG